jgi:hypothetical protein
VLPDGASPRSWAVSGATGDILFGLERLAPRVNTSLGVGWIEDRRGGSDILLLDGDTLSIGGVDTTIVTVASSADGANLRSIALPLPAGATTGGTRAIENAGDIDGDEVDDFWVTAAYENEATDAEVTVARAVSGADGAILWSTELPGERTIFDIQPIPDQTGDGVREFAITLYGAQGGDPPPLPRVALFNGGAGAHLRDLVTPVGAAGAFGRSVAVTSDGMIAVGDDAFDRNRGRVTLHDATTGAHLATVSAPNDQSNLFGYDLIAGTDLSADGVPDLVVSAPGSRGGFGGLLAPRTIVILNESGVQTQWAVAGFESQPVSYEDIGFGLAPITFDDGRRWLATSAPSREVGFSGTEGQIFAFAPPTGCFYDLTADGVVNGADLGALLGQWGQDFSPRTPLQAAANFNSDPFVNGADLALLIANWGLCAD